MVQSKKICCLILAFALLVAVCALCALGVNAEDALIYYLGRGYNVNSMTAKVSSSSLPISTIFETVSNNNIGFGVSYINPSSTSASFSFDPGARFDSSRTLTVTLTSNLTLSSYNLYPSATGWRLDVSYTVIDSSYSGITWFLLNNCYTGTQFSTVTTFTSCSITSPRPDDTEFHSLELGSYFTNYKNSNFSTWYQPNQVSNELPFRRYLYNMSSGFDFYCGALVPDWTDVLHDNVVLKGSCEVVVADTQGYIVSDDSKFSLARPYFVNQTDPSTTGFEYAVVPSTWEQTVTYTKVPVNTFGFKFIVNFYIVIPSTWQTDLSFLPSDIVVLFGGFANSNVDDFIVLFNSYELSYYYRQSSSSPLPDNPNGGFPEEVIIPTPVEQISDQQTWINGQVDSYDDDYSNIVSQINDILAGIDAQFYGSGLNSLYNAMSYSGTDFSFTLPATTIPFPDSSHTLTLWGEQTIPFKQYIDNLPSQYKLIIGYLVLLSSASVTFGCFYIHYLRLIRGNVVVK